jgi:hypothetical protein
VTGRARRFLRDERGMAIPALIGAAAIVFGVITGTMAMRKASVERARNEAGVRGAIQAEQEMATRFDEQARRAKLDNNPDEQRRFELAAKASRSEVTWLGRLLRKGEIAYINMQVLRGAAAGTTAGTALAPGAAVADADFAVTNVSRLYRIGSVQQGGTDEGGAVFGADAPSVVPPSMSAAGSPIPSDPEAAAGEARRQRREAMDAAMQAAEHDAMVNAIDRVLPGRNPAQVQQLARVMLADIQADNPVTGRAIELAPGSKPGGVAPDAIFQDKVQRAVEKIDPGQKPAGPLAAGQIIVTPEDREALAAGRKVQVIGQYVGKNGLEPIVVKPGRGGRLEGQFVTYRGQPKVQFDQNLRQAKPADRPSDWDGTRPSCPYVYAFDGRRFRLVNDIISVSRGPGHEYDDWMLLRGRPGMNGVTEVRIAETRSEESFLDRIALYAVDAARGRELAATPDGQVLALGAVRAPDKASLADRRAAGASPANVRSLASIDGAGPGLFDGDRLTASFAAPGPAAVLVISVDGFETAGADGAPLGRRPAIYVEAATGGGGGRWVRAGVVYPRERTATTALDVSRFASGGRLAVRLTATSCNAGKYQILDRLGLSSSPVRPARLTPISLTWAKRRGSDVRAALSATDGRRLHTVPGDVIRLGFRDPGAGDLLMLARGWYRPRLP